MINEKTLSMTTGKIKLLSLHFIIANHHPYDKTDTLYFGNPAYLKTANEQLVIEMHDSGESKSLREDIGLLISDRPGFHYTFCVTHFV